MTDRIRKFMKNIDDEFTSLMEDGESSGEFTSYIDTGSYILNAQLSGSIYGGIPSNLITAFAGDSATGKTFFAMECARSFLNDNPEGFIVWYDSETAINKEMMKKRGVDTERVIVAEPITVQEFRTHLTNVLREYEKEGNDRPPMMVILDSLGSLSTTKEVEDAGSGKETRDMTRAQVIKSVFRTLTKPLSRLQVPLIIVNHVYSVVGSYIPQKALSGGSGLVYAATTIIELTKSKDKEDKEVVGVLIKGKALKSRLTKENSQITMRLNYRTGLDRYYGLLELGEKAGLIKKVSTKYQFPNGESAFGKHINENPEKYFTKEVLDLLDAAAKREFMYGHEELVVEEEEND